MPETGGQRGTDGRPQDIPAEKGYQASLATVLREWGRIGAIGFGGPPAHIALLRKLCVDRRGWIDAQELEDAIAACNLLPGPASTQLAIFCAWRVRGRLGALAGGVAFIVPGLIVILALSVLFLEGTPPLWVRGTGAGAGAAVAAVAVQAGWSLAGPSWKRAAGSRRVRWIGYLLAGGASAATIGPWLVLVLLGCGITELIIRRQQAAGAGAVAVLPLLAARAIRTAGPARALGAAVGGGVLVSVAWTAFKVGALSFGGGFVIIPLMQADAVGHHWMTNSQFLNGVALGQITPGPVVQTVATVGYAAAGIGGGLLAALVAFSPSFAFVLGGARHFNALRGNRDAQAFLDGAGPAAIGAILGSAIPLARALTQPWQYAVLAGAAVLLLGLRRGVVLTLLAAGAVGLIIALAGGPLPALAPPSWASSRSLARSEERTKAPGQRTRRPCRCGSCGPSVASESTTENSGIRRTEMSGIIVGVDGSGHSQRALEWAMNEAAIRHLPLTVLTVHPSIVGYFGGVVTTHQDLELTEEVRAAVTTEVEKVLTGLNGPHPESVTVKAVHSFPVEELVNASEKADLIVLGSRGVGGFSRLMMGSTADQVVRHAHCPVTIIPPEDRS